MELDDELAAGIPMWSFLERLDGLHPDRSVWRLACDQARKQPRVATGDAAMAAIDLM